ncbi:MAG: hypothetical protein PHS95_01610 [Candidatus Pacebacteria bacterium]|nr:hypothetical protein [Candidatus Paceibacterota bacterium]
MFSFVVKFFDKLEDRVRMRLSHRSILYALIGGVCTILFWRGVWHSGDILMRKGGFWAWMFYEPITIIWTSVALLMTGLFVSNLIGERVIISGLKNEKKVTDRTAKDIQEEENKIALLNSKLDVVIGSLAKIKDELSKNEKNNNS